MQKDIKELLFKKITITTPLTNEVVEKLKTGEFVEISGIVYTARDQAHKKLVELIEKNEELPFDIKGAIIYYTGPTPTKPNTIIGSCGPTTSIRMDKYTPILLKLGLKGIIGKGNRGINVINALKEYKAVYFATYGGCGAYLSKFVKQARLIAYPQLGLEAIYELKVEHFPAIVVNDIYGNDLYTLPSS